MDNQSKSPQQDAHLVRDTHPYVQNPGLKENDAVQQVNSSDNQPAENKEEEKEAFEKTSHERLSEAE